MHSSDLKHFNRFYAGDHVMILFYEKNSKYTCDYIFENMTIDNYAPLFQLVDVS